MQLNKRTRLALSGFALLYSLSSALPAFTQEPPKLYNLKGLVEVRKGKRTHWYSLRAPRTFVYALEGTERTAEMPERLKTVPDLRTQEQIHPVVAKVRDKMIFWMPLVQAAWFGATTYPILKKGK